MNGVVALTKSRFLKPVTIVATLLLVLVVSLLVAGFASGLNQTFTVNHESDAVDRSPGNGRCETSTAGRCTLRAAIQEANALSGHDTIQFAPVTGPRVHAIILADGDHEITGPVTIAGGGPNLTIIDAGNPTGGSPARGRDRLFEVHPNAGNVTISGLTVREGYSGENGGAIQNASTGTLRLENIRVLDSYASKYGGGVNNAGRGRVDIVGSTLSGNGAVEGGSAINNTAAGTVSILAGSEVSGNPGPVVPDPTDPTKKLILADPTDYQLGPGAINNQAESDVIGTIRVADSTISGNAANREGAGIHNERDGNIIVERSTISGNKTEDNGGGIYTTSGTVTVTGTETAESKISDNRAHNGGGIYNAGELTKSSLRSRVDVTRATLSGNAAQASGGGIHNDLEGALTLTDATVTGNDAEDGDGAGVSSQGKTSLAVVRGTYTDNVAAGAGGGIAFGGERELTIEGTTFTGNQAGSDGGGGLYANGKGTVDITGSTFTGNKTVGTQAVEGGDGGGVGIHSFGTVSVTDSVVRDNTSASNGGGVENSGNRVTFEGLRVTGNTAALDGGGIHNSSSGEFLVQDTTAERNTAENGGGFANAADSTLVVRGSLFLGNTARLGPNAESGDSGLGGGFYNLSDGGAKIENSTLSSNTARTAGGGLYTDADAGLNVINATIWRNSAPYGGGISFEIGGSVNYPIVPSTAVILRNTIVAGSLKGGSCEGAVGSEGGNLESGTSCYFQGSRDRANARPALDAIADNGGPTLTHALRPESLAIDGGVRTITSVDNETIPGCPGADQRGVGRPKNYGCDIGAYEYEGSVGPRDEVVPNTRLIDPPSRTGETATFRFTGSDNSTAESELTFECRILNNDPTEPPEPPDPTEPPDPEFAFIACASPWQVMGVEDGPNTLEVRAVDRAGNVDPTPATHQFIGGEDVNPPETLIVEKPPDPSSGRTATFTFDATDDLTPRSLIEIECRIDSRDPEAWLECVNPTTFSNLTTGRHTVEARAIDEGDNIDPTPARYTWTVSEPTNCDQANITLGAAADGWVDQVNPQDNRVLDDQLTVRSGDMGSNARAMYRFALPGDAPNCQLESATMRLYSTSSTPGRTLEATPIASSWSENGVTWNNQPGTTGTPATTTSGDGYREWNVTSQVQGMISGVPNYGFMIRDKVEDDPEGGDQDFASRQTPQDPPVSTLPQLVLRYEPADSPPPPTPAPPVATEVSCGQVLTRSTLVTNDLTDCEGEGLVIGAPNIEVDLDGHTIDGLGYFEGQPGTTGPIEPPEEGLPAGIRNSGHDNVIIHDGTVKEFGHGVRLTAGTKRSVVEQLTLQGNATTGIELSDADDGRTGNQVRNNTIEDNQLGISLVNDSENSVAYDNTMNGNLGAAVYIQGSRGNRIESNTISGVPTNPNLDSDGGMLLEDGAGNNVLLNNTLADTGDAGLVIQAGSHGNRVEGNTMTRNGDAGVSIQDSDRTVVVGNIAHQMSDSGIGLNGANDSLIQGNDVRFNPGGIELEGSENNRIENNDASKAQGVGISVAGLGNEIVNNTASETSATGILVSAEAFDNNGNPIEGNLIEGNTTNQNLADGISVAAGGHTILDNDAHNNSAWGISAGEGADDGGGNAASGNARPEQCEGVVCDTGGSVPVVPPDTEPPDTVIIGKPDSLSTDTTARFTFTGIDEGTPETAMRFECRLDPGPDPPPPPPDPDPDPPEPGEPPDLPDPVDPTDPESWSECGSPKTYRDLEPGEHTFQVRAIDPADYRDFSAASYTWAIELRPEEPGPDSTPPDTRITEKPADPSNNDSATFKFTGSDDTTPGLDLTFQCRLDGQADAGWASCTSPKAYSNLAQGSHTFDVRALDRSGNADPTPATHTWAYEPPPADTTAPETTIDSAPDPTTASPNAGFTFSSSETNSTFECSLDNAAFAACASPKEYASLSVGNHEVRVRATDTAGNTDGTPAGHAWKIGPAPVPAEVSCGQTLTRSTLVTNDLTDCSGNGLVIGANEITVDLDGHIIDGVGQGTGILNNGFDSATVTNGTVQEFGTGVLLNSGTAQGVVSSLVMDANRTNGIVLSGADEAGKGNALRSNTVTSNVQGITLQNGTQHAEVLDNTVGANTDQGIRVENSTDNRIEANRVSGSSDVGISLEGADDNTLIRNTLTGNDAGGIAVGAAGIASDGNRLERNTVNESGAAGILVTDSNTSQLIRNIVHESNDSGIVLENAQNSLLQGNDVRFNPGGISLSGSNGNRLEANVASESQGAGISLEALSLDNDLVLNTANANDSEGIYVGDPAPAGAGNLIDRNTTNNNTADGIAVGNVGHTIVGNTANDNGGWGIYAAEGSTEGSNTDGGGNRASGNVEPGQCFQVRCDGGPPMQPELAPPDTSIIAKPNNPSSSRSAGFTFTGTDDNTPLAELEFQCRFDSQNEADFVDCENPQDYTNLRPGTHTFEVRAVDLAEKVDPTPATYTWNYQPLPPGVAPDTTIDLKPAAETPLLDAVFTFSANEPDVTFECKMDAGPFEPCEYAAEYSFEETQAGRHTFQVRARDAEGNVDPTPAGYTWTITGVVTTFTAGPAFEPGTETEPPTGGETESRDATFEFAANVADATYECSLDFGPFEPCESPVTYTGLAIGEHELRVVATDPEGREELEPAEYQWTVVAAVDTTPPNTTITERPANNSDSTVFRFTGTDDVTTPAALEFECRLDSTLEEDFSSCTSPYNILDELPEFAPGEHTFDVRAIDAADPVGNVDPTPATYTWTSAPDATAPTARILTGPSARTAATDVQFTFSATDNTTPEPQLAFECSLDGAPFEACDSPHDVQGLEPGEHQLRVRATDLSGNAGSPVSHTWTVVGPPETLIASGPDATSASAAARFVFSADQAGSRFECSLDGAPFTACTSPVEYTDLDNGDHELLVRATNPEGTVDETPASYGWTVAVPLDTTAPQTAIDSGPAATVATAGATFAFSANEPGVTFECSLDGSPFAACVSPRGLTGLADGRHDFRVRATDAAGNIGDPAVRGWTVDTSAPQTALGDKPAALTSSTSARFTSSASEPGSTFECSLDGSTFAACGSTKEYASLTPGEHAFRVQATDTAGNTDPTPERYAWTVDTSAPQTTLEAGGPSGTTTSTNARFAFSANEQGSRFECSLDGSPFTACVSPREYTNLSVGNHEFRVRSVDGAGNVDGSPEVRTWTVQAQPTCAAQPVTARSNADGWIHQKDASKNFGSDAIMKVSPKNGERTRALVRFNLPTIPAGCQVATAELRLYNASPKSGRTIQALQLTGNWSEGGVNWSNQPGTTGSVATATTPSSAAFMKWSVTAQVQGMYTGANHGFLIREASEGSGDAEQQFHSREKGPDRPPELVITFR